MRLDSPGWLGVDETLLAVARQVEYTVVRNGSAWIRFLQDVRETLMGAPRTSARASNAGSSGTLRARHASQARVPRGLVECPAGAPRVPGGAPRGLVECPAGAPRVPGAGAARARRVPCGCATRPRCGRRAGSSSALRVRHASQVRAPRGLIECPAG